MKQLSFWAGIPASPISILLITLMVLMTGVPNVWAYESYSTSRTSGSCANCHGGFRTNPYISLSDGADWGDDLHDVHRQTMLNSDCDVCHVSSRFPVSLDSSAGGTGLAPISCVGCHGREEDIGNDSESVGRGAGLRQHHTNAGVTSCQGCHSDADPANYIPVGEDILPEYYANPGTDHPIIPTDPCNPAGEEGAFAGTLLGLDNDGDGVYDTADDDCSINTPPVADAGGPYSGTAGSPVSFDGSGSSDPDGSIASYAWDFGDGSSGSGVSPTHTYATDGSYSVSLTVTDNDGASDTATSSATIVSDEPPPGTVTIDEAAWVTEGRRSKLVVTGIQSESGIKSMKGAKTVKDGKAVQSFRARRGMTVIITNANTGEKIGKTRIRKNGEWKFEKRLEIAPCRVRATINDEYGEKDVSNAPDDCNDGTVQSQANAGSRDARPQHQDGYPVPVVKGYKGTREKW